MQDERVDYDHYGVSYTIMAIIVFYAAWKVEEVISRRQAWKRYGLNMYRRVENGWKDASVI